MKGYKGFDKDFKCQGYQFEVGKTYEEPSAILCKKGFHFCEHPLNVFDYYAPPGNHFCEVTAAGVSDETRGDTKRVATKITIGAELTIAGLVKAAVDYTFERAKPVRGSTTKKDQGAASATGEDSVALAAGLEAKAKGTLVGCAICCVERNKDDGHIIAVKAAIIDGELLKDDTYYTLKNGEFVAVD